MKQSHFQCPRTLGECNFAMNADPIEVYTTGDYSRAFMATLYSLAAVALVVIWATS